MKSRLLYICILSCFFLSNRLIAQQSAFANKRPNIIFIMADDLGYNDLGCYGNSYVQTPNIDKLANGGYRFLQAYVNAPNCAPSRACLFSGMFTPKHGIYTVDESTRGKNQNRKLIPVENNTILDSAFITLAEGLTKTGYDCISIGKWHLGVGAYGPTGQGFARNVAGSNAGSVKSHFSPFKTDLPNLGEQSDGKFLADALVDKAVNYIGEKHTAPFFLYLPFYSVHSPVQAPDSLIKKYEKRLPAGVKITAAYAAMIENLDSNIGRIIQKLNKTDLSKNTLIVFLSDNGPVLDYTSVNLRGEKGSLYEGGIREPMIINWANHLKPGQIVNQPVMAVDFYPTFMELAGLQKTRWPKALDGTSLLPLFNGALLPADRPMIWHFPAYLQADTKDKSKIWRETPSSAIRIGDWKLVKHYGNQKTELFNIAVDPKETNDLYAVNPKKVTQLQQALDAYLKKTKAFIPSKLNPEYIQSAKNDLAY